jgi:hypothetical protein
MTKHKQTGTHRDEWECYEVLHDGEGPLRRHQKILSVQFITAEEAAKCMADAIRWTDERNDGECFEEGVYWWIAVEISDGEFEIFKVRQEIERPLIPTSYGPVAGATLKAGKFNPYDTKRQSEATKEPGMTCDLRSRPSCRDVV